MGGSFRGAKRYCTRPPPHTHTLVDACVCTAIARTTHMPEAGLQVLAFDVRRGNQEGREADKVLAFWPPDTPLEEQSGLAGLLQGLLLFTATFAGVRRAGRRAGGGAAASR